MLLSYDTNTKCPTYCKLHKRLAIYHRLFYYYRSILNDMYIQIRYSKPVYPSYQLNNSEFW